MDFQVIADSFYSPTCVVSVEKTEDGGYGEIRLVAANKKYLEMINQRIEQEPERMSSDKGSAFVPGSLYTDYFPHNRSFETICHRAAIRKTEVHTYAHLHTVDVWFDIYAIPLDYQDGNVFYCTYAANPNKNPDMILNGVKTSQASEDVLKTCITLHKADNLKDAMKNVIAEIRKICNAEGCTVLLINYDEAQYSILATDYVAQSAIKRVTQFQGFYEIAASWEKMIGDEGDCIIIENQEDMDYVKEVNNPWYLTLVEAGVKSVVLYPLRQGKELLGFIWAINFDTEKTMRIKETLELTTFFVSAHIARYKALTRLQHMSYTDGLTKLPNRFACTEYVSGLVSRGEKFALVSIDLNHFKSVNDTLGLEAGNRVLIEIADRWKAVCNKRSDCETYVTRISGDEFFLVIGGYHSQEELRNEIDRYVEALRKRLTIDGCDLYVSASFGYAEFPTDADNADALISHANAAMIEIKKAKSSEHVLRFTPELLRDEHVLEIENVIRMALEKDTLYFHLQPQYDVNHNLRGFEALARMKDGDGKNVSPGEFIPIAEKVGLIDRVDGIVFKKAAAFFGELLRRTGADLMLSINASVRHLMKNDFPDEIRELLKISGIPADKLEIEITESIMIDSADKALQCIDEIRSMGIKIAIDDFGTGYSSLSYLNRFPANLLKIDKSFIDKMNTNDSSRQYVAAIISMGHVMGFEVISEGVEEPEQLDALKNIGCDFIQGFIWGRPLPAEDAEKLVMGLV